MLDTFDTDRLQQMQPDDISDSLESGSIVFFPESPVQIPSAEDLAFIRQELPELLRLKNVSYHPEAGRVRGLDEADPEMAERVKRILVDVSDNIAGFLAKKAPRLVDNWTVGTCSFRPIEEQGRKLDAHASNELVHIDAGAYGATNGDRILRFFINVNPTEDRVWVTKGSFPELFQSHGEQARLGYADAGNEFKTVRRMLEDDSIFQDAIQTPLDLNIMMIALQDVDIENFSLLDPIKKPHRFLWDTYVQRMFKRFARTASDLYSQNQSINSLSWLATELGGHNQTIHSWRHE